MCSRLQGEKTPRYLRKCLLHRFRCHRHFLFQKDSSPFIQNAVTRRAISKIHTDRQPLLLENFTLEYLYSANLLHSRSPFLCASSTSIIGSASHPAGDRPSHPNLINAESRKSTCPVWRLERSRSAADASRGTNGAVVACWL